MKKLTLTLTLCALSGAAAAWPTPEVALDEFLKFELNGGRLSSDSYAQYEARYAHLPEDHEEGGWDSVAVIESLKAGALTCDTSSCAVDITLNLAAGSSLDGPPFINDDAASVDTLALRILNKDGDWRVVAPDTTPMISLETYRQY